MGPRPGGGMRDRDLGLCRQVEFLGLIEQVEVRREGEDKKVRDSSCQRGRGW